MYVGICLPLRASPIPAVTKRIVGIFDVMAERENCLVGSNGSCFFKHPHYPYPTFLPYSSSSSSSSSYSISLFCSPHRCVFLEASETGCLIEASQVYRRGWGEATVNPTLCYQPCGSHNEADMHTQASTFTQIHIEINAHRHTGLSTPNKSLV